MTPAEALLLGGSAFGAGVMNSIAGGGTILTFPALIAFGLPAISANATSTVALLPASASSMAGYRREVESHTAWLRALFLPSLIGGAAGSVLLLSTPEKLFARLAPWLILFATGLFLVQGALARRKGKKDLKDGKDPKDKSGESVGLPAGRFWGAAGAQLGIAVYGGYFGAGIGILMLALLGFLGLSDIHAMNGLKNFFNLCINLIAAGLFIARGAVVWPVVLVMLPCAILGGYGGARLARYIGRERARAAVVGIGIAMAALLFWQQGR
ncbi:MAG TPA: sulfite exporter TauE/SafE family protein [Thermoanaerobaculia bacterium]|nr:sulfite exporter TauE/SafE family protein [Thermoanaerobaculia bacterium]